jgi:hypothetical protein
MIDYTTGNLIDSYYYYHSYSDITGEGTEELKEYTTFEELPTYIKLPKFDTIDGDHSENKGYLFHGEYQLMKYQGDEWTKVGIDDSLSDIIANTKARHEHLNKDVLDTITPEMLEAEIPIVHTLPTESKSGDICRYILKNKIMPEDSGKRIYFDWKNIKHFSLKEVTRHILYSASTGYGAASREVLSIIIENLNKSFHYFIKTRIDNEYIRILSVNFKSNGQFSSGSLSIQDLSGN